MTDRTLERFDQASNPKYTWEYRPTDSDYHKARYVLVSHDLERRIEVGPNDNQIKLYDTSLSGGGVGEMDWIATEPEDSAEEWIRDRINYQHQDQR